MIRLITKADILARREISSNVPDKKINPFIDDAQFVDIQKLLGGSLFNDLIQNSTDANYVSLLDEGTYEYNGVTYTNIGLKAVLVEYAYSRYILLGANTDTPFGLVQKDNGTSTQSDYNTKKSMSKASENLAFNYWENVKRFLDRNRADYPYWDENCSKARRTTFKINRIG